MYGKSSLASESGVSGWRMSRARGPQSAKHDQREVVSAIWTLPSRGAWLRSHAASCWPNAVPVTIWKRSSASRATVKSHSIPPRALSICV